MIDTGETHECTVENAYEYCGKQRKFIDLPPRCFKCSLAQLQPSQVRNPNGFWPPEANRIFKEKTAQMLIEIEVNARND